ncbi:ferrous iron transport protein B [Helicobacter didelphidarum]|uniref:Ferrous iron transport protein B n=1 Tax=Helicobacter didelphidarum TaxID=2040648 RepID=A0A3D8IR67_9HELI|nr:ferrous iron transport protein B [Helicobacter didelphidarum]RDU67470.1 ferrous iron transport protein B [Helicobacter didelphidarum]
MKKITIVLVGQPNVGKSSLINAISGAKMRVGNFSGVTIEKAEKTFHHKDYMINIVDLPGTFALNGYTMEEKVCKQFLLHEYYDVILNVLDATNLERNLILTLQLKELQKQTNKKIFVALNMIDEAKNDGLEIDIELLSKQLGLEVCAVSSVKEHNLDMLLDGIIALYEQTSLCNRDSMNNTIKVKESPSLNDRIENISQINHNLELNNQTNKPLLKNFSQLPNTDRKTNFNTITITSQNALLARNIATSVQKNSAHRGKYTKALDSILLHRFWSVPIFLFAMFIVFEVSFELGKFLQDLFMDEVVGPLATWSKTIIHNELLGSLIGDGVINGVGTVVGFLPLIATLFLGLTLLEGSGYMARIAFMLDGLLFHFGLHGRSFVPLVLGFGCSVPAYMATRTLQNQRDKLLTLFIIGFMSCSARMPIYLLFVSAFFATKYAGIIMFAIYVGGVLIALCLAWVLKKLVFKGNAEPFVMDMPRYRIPTLRVIWFSVWGKSYMFLRKAGSVILIGAVFVWALASFPQSNSIAQEYSNKMAFIESLGKKDIQSSDIDIHEKQDFNQSVPDINEKDSGNNSLDFLQTFDKNKLLRDLGLESFMLDDTTKMQQKDSQIDIFHDKILSEEETKKALIILQNEMKEKQLEYSFAGRLGHIMEPLFAPLGFDWRLSVSLITGFAAKEMVVTTLGVLYALGDEVVDSEDDNFALQETLRKHIALPGAVAFILFIMLYIPCFAATATFAYESGKKIYTFYLLIFTTGVAYFFAYVGHEITRFILNI